MTLAALVAAAPEPMLGVASAQRYGPTTGVLVKMIALAEPAPLRAHPDAAFTQRELGLPFGKAEAWVIVDPAGDGTEPAYAGMGTVPGVTRESFRAAIDRRSSADLRAMVHRTPIAAGEANVLSPRIPHLLGPGVFFIELQEPSDLAVMPEGWTLGADEAGSTLGLGWDRALDSIDLVPVAREAAIAASRQVPVELERQGSSVVTQLIGPGAGGWFECERWDVADTLDVPPGRFSVDIVLAGDGRAEGDWGATALHRGEALAWPAQAGHRYVAGSEPLVVIRSMGPRA
jgi:mannose-6-phosphate isomerase